ncbi:hypothetical protein LOK49_LG14G00629 [Camellia lanceoleosa]|uniref:Uncharacterized protein n=1 Tax=Camellia lanceoleosa TaxID=1840588 RepID=A0ACC0FA10_9ERIC|nr:hypothetical protein LOK49_LG14G00629 [Camellia lanceoleosa]
MANYHFMYKDVEGASTQWDDIQKKLGNLPPKPPSFKPAEDEDSKHKDKARHRECDYHRRLRLSVDPISVGVQYDKIKNSLCALWTCSLDLLKVLVVG